MIPWNPAKKGKLPRRRSLRLAIIASVSLLEFILALVMAYDIREHWGAYSAARTLSTVDRQVDALVLAGEALAIERGRTLILLRGALPYDQAE